jgi:AcrR family transcriptional regulator
MTQDVQASHWARRASLYYAAADVTAPRRSRYLLTGPYNLYKRTKPARGKQIAKAEFMTRNPNMREAILSAAELLFSTRGFNAVSIRDIALEAGANPGSITYHFKSKDGLLLEIYKRHCGPMNRRRIELLVAAKRVRDVQDRLEAIVRAYVQPAFSSSSDLAGGGARFTRLRAVMSAEGNAVVGRIIAEIFDDTTNAFIEAVEQSLPHLPRKTIVWRSQFLLGALYYTLVNPERVTRLSRGEADGADMADAIEQLVSATVASFQAPDSNAGAVEVKPAELPRKKAPAISRVRTV